MRQWPTAHATFSADRARVWEALHAAVRLPAEAQPRQRLLSHASSPTASQRPIDLNQSLGHLAMRSGLSVLLLDKVLLDLRNTGEVDAAGLVLLDDRVDRQLQTAHAFVEQLGAVLFLQEVRQPVLRLFRGLEHHPLVDRDELLEFCVLQPHVVADAAIIQDIPLHPRADRAVEGVGLEKLREAVPPSSPCRR